MEAPCVLLRTKEVGYFTCQNGYQGVSVPELETLLEQARETVRSLEVELEQRQVTAKQSNVITQCSEKLQTCIGNLKILERLDKRAAGLVITATKILTTQQTSRESRVYQTFLGDVLRQCGRGMALLCAAGLGKQRVTTLSSRDRIQLVHYLKSNKAIFKSPILDLLAEKYQIPDDCGASLPSTYCDILTNVSQELSTPDSNNSGCKRSLPDTSGKEWLLVSGASCFDPLQSRARLEAPELNADTLRAKKCNRQPQLKMSTAKPEISKSQTGVGKNLICC